MKKGIISIAIISAFLIGCGNLSPRENVNPKLQQDIQNQQGRIDRIENNQNSIRADIERISLINKQDNSQGIQILQGEGGLVLVFGLLTIFAILFYFYKTAESERKKSEILASQIVEYNDEELGKIITDITFAIK